MALSFDKAIAAASTDNSPTKKTLKGVIMMVVALALKDTQDLLMHFPGQEVLSYLEEILKIKIYSEVEGSLIQM